MQMQIILEPINFYYLLGTGVFLIALEAIISSFILIWFGIGFLITAFISVLFPYKDGVWQLATIAIISLGLLLVLRKKSLEKFLQSDEEINDNFLNEMGIGEIKNGKVFFKGTFWEIDSNLDENEFEEGEKIKVLKTYKNFASIEKR